MTCETRGLLPGTAAAVAALQFTEALKLLLDLDANSLCGLLRIDVWDAVLRRVPLPTFGRRFPIVSDLRGSQLRLSPR